MSLLFGHAYIHGLAAGDIDNDGVNEIVVTNGWDDWNYLYIYDGVTYEEEWDSESSFKSLGQSAHYIEIIDVDSDGINEIIVNPGGYFYILGMHINMPPIIDPISDKEVDENVLLEFSLIASDLESTIMPITAENLPEDAIFIDHGDNTADFTWTPTHEQSGVYMITFSVFDGEFTESQDVTITVNNIVNDPPILNAIGNKDADEGVLLEFTTTANDPDGLPVTYTEPTIPQGASFTDNGDGTAQFSWRPTFYQAGTYNVTLEVSDGYYTVSEEITITVNNINGPPVFNYVADREVIEGEELEFSVSAIDPDNDGLTYSTGILPGQASFDPSTKTFYWQPEHGDLGDHNVTFEVSDSNATVSEIITISVIREQALLDTVVSLDGYRLNIQYSMDGSVVAGPMPYKIKGVCWSPSSIGSPGGGNLVSRKAEFFKWYQADIPLMRDMNVNTVRVFLDFGTEDKALDVLDMLHQNGIMAIMTVDNGIADQENLDAVVNKYKDHPAVLMWAIGNEWDYNHYYDTTTYPTLDDAIAVTEQMAQRVKELDQNHPVGSIIIYSNITQMERIITECPSVDIWGVNIYLGASFWGFLDDWKELTQAAGIIKPVFLSEMGCDAYDVKQGAENQRAQSDYDDYLWREVYPNMSSG